MDSPKEDASESHFGTFCDLSVRVPTTEVGGEGGVYFFHDRDKV